MNLPNKLSIARILLIPMIIAAMYFDTVPMDIVALALFCIAALTDYFDGHIARKQGIITNFGRFIDPVADKMLVISAFVMMVARGVMPAWILVAIIFRELFVDGLRMIASAGGIIIAAGKLGKLKTVIQIAAIIGLFVQRFISDLVLPVGILVWAAFLVTLWSGIDYFLKNKHVFQEPREEKHR